MARDYVSLMPTSVPSEKTFSIGRLTVDDTRTKLHSKKLLCLKSWLN